MRKLVGSTFVSLDGIISSPQAWGARYWDDEHEAYARRLLFASDALLLGRETYEGFAQAWPSRTGEFADRINSLPKYVATTTLRSTEWNATVLEGDVAQAILELKREPGRNILKYGTGELDPTLLEDKLVDEYHFWIYPVVAGSGARLFDGVDLTHLELVETTRFASGIVVGVYRPS